MSYSIGIIGFGASDYNPLPQEAEHLERIAKFLAGTDHEILYFPESGGQTEDFARLYSEAGGKKISGVAAGDVLRRIETMMREIDLLVVVGYSFSTLLKLSIAGHLWRGEDKRAMIVSDLVQEQPPRQILSIMRVESVLVNELLSYLKQSS
ncbi:MAG: hypothetical protein NUW37_12525 [Planctomycetes bacterium]|nr:hypothetical protein [Planctomycetota bacterium]